MCTSTEDVHDRHSLSHNTRRSWARCCSVFAATKFWLGFWLRSCCLVPGWLKWQPELIGRTASQRVYGVLPYFLWLHMDRTGDRGRDAAFLVAKKRRPESFLPPRVLENRYLFFHRSCSITASFRCRYSLRCHFQ